MRWWARLVALGVALTIILASLSFWTRCGDERPAPSAAVAPPDPAGPPLAQRGQDVEDSAITDMRCTVNEQYSVACKTDGEEVYFPFTFIKKYFEVYGEMAEDHGRRVFKWSHSYGKVYPPAAPYRPDGEFMYFGSYNVEKRDRVKCISGEHGVPVTTQWLPAGFFYAVQIAQFGLSHYSRNLTDPPPKRTSLLSSRAYTDGNILTVRDTDLGEDVSEFTSPHEATIEVNIAGRSILTFDLKVETNASLRVDLLFSQPSKAVRIHYVCSNLDISSQGSDVYIGLGRTWSGYKRFIRDLTVDALKGAGGRARGRGRSAAKLTPQRLRVQAVVLSGSGRLRQLQLSSSEHAGQFLQAADWLVSAQHSETGGWTIPVERQLNGRMVLRPPWCSAMGQGQAMSVLTRAFRVTGDRRYLEAARLATKPFSVDSSDGGVRTHYLDKFVWYEEYPTVPSSLVLNGFIYSLMGLYDLSHTAGGGQQAARLYSAGLASLRVMLPMFDTGSGTLYDLRHVTSGAVPNLARWDYHVTHINQLLVLATMEPDLSALSETAARWTEYMNGRRAAHN